MGKGLPDVFSFWLSQNNKFVDVLKQIPIFKGVSLFHTIIAIAVIGIFINVIKFGLRFKAVHPKTYGDRVYTSERGDLR